MCVCAQVFSDLSHVKINATKSMIGHCLGAAGGLEAVATIKAIRTGWVHPTINHVRAGAGGGVGGQGHLQSGDSCETCGSLPWGHGPLPAQLCLNGGPLLFPPILFIHLILSFTPHVKPPRAPLVIQAPINCSFSKLIDMPWN